MSQEINIFASNIYMDVATASAQGFEDEAKKVMQHILLGTYVKHAVQTPVVLDDDDKSEVGGFLSFTYGVSRAVVPVKEKGDGTGLDYQEALIALFNVVWKDKLEQLRTGDTSNMHSHQAL